MSNEKFRVKYGLAVGDNTTETAMTVDGTTGDINTNGSITALQNLDIRGSSTLGNAPADTVTVNGDTLINNALTIGSSSGDTVTVNSQVAGNVLFSDNNTASNRGVIGTVGNSDAWFVGGAASGANAGYMVIATGDDGTEPIYVRQYDNGTPISGTTYREATLLDASGNTIFPGNITSAGHTMGNISVGVVTDNTIASTNTNGDIVLTPNGTGTVVVSSKETVGSNASLTDFPNAQFIASQANGGDTHTYNIGVVGEAVANSGDSTIWGVGVYGTGKTNGATRSAGVMGDGSVTATGDTGSAIGVRGYATDTHAGGYNIGVLGEATGSSVGNLAFYSASGDWAAAGAVTITTLGSNGNITLTPNGTGTVISSSDLAVNGGDITTTQTTASLYNTTATTLNIGGASTVTNIGSKTAGSIIKGTNRFTSPTISAFLGSASPSQGLLLSNGAGSSAAAARNSMVLRIYPTAGGPRGNIIYESARGTETTPTAIQNNDLVGEISATGYTTNGWITDYVGSIPGQILFTATEAWANTGGPFPTAGTVTNSGTGCQVLLQPTATNLSAASRIAVLNINPQSFLSRSDQYLWSKGKTNNSTMATLNDDGGGKISFSVVQPRATSSTNFALVNFTTQRSTDGINYTPTQLDDTIGGFKFNGNANTSTSPGVPGGPGAEIIARATENWSSTANGTKFQFYAMKTGTIDSYAVIEGNPDSLTLNSTETTIKSYDTSTTYATFNATSATFTTPVGFPVDTAANWNTVTGATGQQVCVSDSPTYGGKMAYWDQTTPAWRYVGDDSLV
jgi:hypothetical protein